MTFNEFIHNPVALYYLSAALVVVPLARIFQRAGFSLFWVALLAVPDAGLIFCLAVLALRKWPRSFVKSKEA